MKKQTRILRQIIAIIGFVLSSILFNPDYSIIPDPWSIVLGIIFFAIALKLSSEEIYTKSKKN